MKISTRTACGIGVTLLYFGVVLWLRSPFTVEGIRAMRINEFGDALAGIVGPVALLWLVLGYFQQGDELRQNGEALRLQADELKNAVDQHKEMVKASNAHLEHAKRVRAEENRPKFIVRKCASVASNTIPTAVVILQLEQGATVGLNVSSEPEVAPRLEAPNILRPRDTARILWHDVGNKNLKLRLEFQDENENPYSQTLVMRRASNGVWEFRFNEYDT